MRPHLLKESVNELKIVKNCLGEQYRNKFQHRLLKASGTPHSIYHDKHPKCDSCFHGDALPWSNCHLQHLTCSGSTILAELPFHTKLYWSHTRPYYYIITYDHIHTRQAGSPSDDNKNKLHQLLFSVTDTRLSAQERAARSRAALLKLGNKNHKEPQNFTLVLSKAAHDSMGRHGLETHHAGFRELTDAVKQGQTPTYPKQQCPF